MAKVISYGYSDTPIEGVASLNFARGLVNFAQDFEVIKDVPGKEVILTNLTCDDPEPERVRIGYTEVSNIYAGTSIEPSVSAPTKKGTQILLQLTEVVKVTDDTDPTYQIDLPVSYHLVIKIPKSEYVTSDAIVTGLGRLVSCAFNTGSLTTARIDALRKGALKPSDV